MDLARFGLLASLVCWSLLDTHAWWERKEEIMSYYYYKKSFDCGPTFWQGLKPHLENHLFKLLKVIVHAELDFSICFNYSLLLGYSILHFLNFKCLLDWYFSSCLRMNAKLQTEISCLNSFTQLWNLFWGLLWPILLFWL